MPVILALVVVQIIYASGVIVGKFVLLVVPAPVIVTVRMIIASIAFYFAHRAIKGSVPRTAGAGGWRGGPRGRGGRLPPPRRGGGGGGVETSSWCCSGSPGPRRSTPRS